MVYRDGPYTVVRRHSHPTAAISLMLEGDQVERIGARSWHVPRFSIIYRPPHLVHSNHVGKRGLRTLFLEVPRHRYRTLMESLPSPDDPCRVESPQLCALAGQLGVDDLICECLVALSRASRVSRPARGGAPWLDHVREFLDSSFRRTLSLAEVADVAGVHPVHLAQSFRRTFRRTIGQYVRHRRLEAACRDLEDRCRSISEIALAAGFADHAHFTRAFRARFGQSPRAYRASLMVGCPGRSGL